jgi:hypothetical protein
MLAVFLTFSLAVFQNLAADLRHPWQMLRIRGSHLHQARTTGHHVTYGRRTLRQTCIAGCEHHLTVRLANLSSDPTVTGRTNQRLIAPTRGVVMGVTIMPAVTGGLCQSRRSPDGKSGGSRQQCPPTYRALGAALFNDSTLSLLYV